MTFIRLLIGATCLVICVLLAVAFIWEMQPPDTTVLRLFGGWAVIGIGANLYASITNGS